MSSGAHDHGPHDHPHTHPDIEDRLAKLEAAPTPTPEPTPIGWRHDFRTDGFGPFAYDSRWGTNGLVYSTHRNAAGTDHGQSMTAATMSVDGAGLHARLIRRSTTNGAPMAGGVISTKGRHYVNEGIVVARMKWDMGRAYWPAFWQLADGSGKQHEIDILEAYGLSNGLPLWNGYEVALHNTSTRLFLASVRDVPPRQWHEIGVEYRPGRLIRWLANGQEVARREQNVPTVPMSIIFNMIAGSYHAGVDSSTPNGELSVEWVEVRP